MNHGRKKRWFIQMTKGETMDAWVVFSGKADIAWLKVLRPGFRHCFVLLNDGQRWMSIDPLSTYTEVEIYHHIGSNFTLPHWLEQRGYKVAKTSINKNKKKPAPWMFFTCVEAIKRILGIQQRLILTPWQLYRFLKKNNQLQISKGN